MGHYRALLGVTPPGLLNPPGGQWTLSTQLIKLIFGISLTPDATPQFL